MPNQPVDVRGQMDAIYGGLRPADIPWNAETPPELLVRLVDSGWIAPCDAVDLGCGAGNYAVWLASKGFRMSGLDVSRKAIELAQALASERDVPCRFVVVDLLGEVRSFHASFDFAYDWEMLHHVFPDQREQYARNVVQMLRPGGKYLSVCFSDRDQAFGGHGKYRATPLGTTLYFSSEPELRALFEPLFDILELRTTEIRGRCGSHQALVARLVRR